MISRRGLMSTGLKLALVGALPAAAGRVMAADGGKCADSKMDPGLAESLHYTEAAPDPKQACGGCGYFTATSGGCGSCLIFNSPVNSKGHCESWAPKG